MPASMPICRKLIGVYVDIKQQSVSFPNNTDIKSIPFTA